MANVASQTKALAIECQMKVDNKMIENQSKQFAGENSLALVQQKIKAVLSRPFRLHMKDILMPLFEVLFNKHFSIDFGSQRFIEMQIHFKK